MPTKQPVPPPKFNIRDQVTYKQVRYKVTNRRYIASNWVYSLELNECHPNPLPAGTTPEVKESALELAPPSKLDPMHFPVPETPPQPAPKYKVKERVLCGPPEDEVYITSIHPFDGVYGWKYSIKRYSKHGGLIDYGTHIPEDIIKPYTPQETMTVVNEQGGRQSHLDARFDCIPPVVLRLLAQCLGFGARKYGKDNWKKIPQWDHLNHALNHINEWNRGNRDEPHLVNAMARLTFALWQAVDSNDQPVTYTNNS